MEVGARMFLNSSRSAMAIVGLSTILALSGLWNCRQYQVIEHLRSRERAAQEGEARRANAEAGRAEAQRKKKAEWAASDARLQQLYREINTLSQINEHISQEPVPRRPAVHEDHLADPLAGRP